MPADQEEADEAEVRARAVKLLARREHAPAELVQKLAQRGYPPSLCDRVVETLSAENLVSESRYSESMARSRAELGHGPMRIRAELSAKGVDEGVIDRTLAELDVDWRASAAAERRKRFGEARPADFPTRARQMRFLQQRGFTGEQIRAVIGDD